jgi:hypothetical protein
VPQNPRRLFSINPVTLFAIQGYIQAMDGKSFLTLSIFLMLVFSTFDISALVERNC